MFVFKLPPFFPHLHDKQGKKGGNLKTSLRFTETIPLLYCLSSNANEALRTPSVGYFAINQLLFPIAMTWHGLRRFQILLEKTELVRLTFARLQIQWSVN